jgi:adenosylmethionine-8-amino-7-oxononanoate aminotransferase
LKSVFYSSLDKVYKTIDRGEGVYVYDNEGNNYLDCAAGIAVSNRGYGVKEVIDAMHEQAKKITYVYGGTFTSEAKERLANQIIDLAPDGMEKVFFCSGGSEAVEGRGKRRNAGSRRKQSTIPGSPNEGTHIRQTLCIIQ